MHNKASLSSHSDSQAELNCPLKRIPFRKDHLKNLFFTRAGFMVKQAEQAPRISYTKAQDLVLQ